MEHVVAVAVIHARNAGHQRGVVGHRRRTRHEAVKGGNPVVAEAEPRLQQRGQGREHRRVRRRIQVVEQVDDQQRDQPGRVALLARFVHDLAAEVVGHRQPIQRQQGADEPLVLGRGEERPERRRARCPLGQRDAALLVVNLWRFDRSGGFQQGDGGVQRLIGSGRASERHGKRGEDDGLARRGKLADLVAQRLGVGGGHESGPFLLGA